MRTTSLLFVLLAWLAPAAASADKVTEILHYGDLKCSADMDCVAAYNPCGLWMWYAVNASGRQHLATAMPDIENCQKRDLAKPDVVCRSNRCVYKKNADNCVLYERKSRACYAKCPNLAYEAACE